MAEGLDIVLDQLKKLDGYGVTTRLLSTTQNLPPAVLILNRIMDQIKENGGAYELHGGLGASGGISIAGLIGGEIGADFGDDSASLGFVLNLNDTKFGLQIAYDGISTDPDAILAFTTTIRLPAGVGITIEVSGVHRNEAGTIDKAEIKFSLAAGVGKSGVVEGNVSGGPFLKVTAFDYGWYIDNRFTDVLADISIHNGNWSSVASKLGVAGVSQADFVRALKENKSSGDFLVDIARAAAGLSSQTSGSLNISADYSEVPQYINNRFFFPASLEKLTVAGAHGGATGTWSKNSNGETVFVKSYIQNTTEAGKIDLTASYNKLNPSSNPADNRRVNYVEVLEYHHFDGNGIVRRAVDGTPIVTKITTSYFPTETGPIVGNINNGGMSKSGDSNAVIYVTYYDFNRGTYVSEQIVDDSRSAAQVLELLDRQARDPRGAFVSVDNGLDDDRDTFVFESVSSHFDAPASGSVGVKRIESVGLSFGDLLEPDQGPAGEEGGDSDEIVVTAPRFRRKPAADAELKRNANGSITITYRAVEGGPSQSVDIVDPAAVESIVTALKAQDAGWGATNYDHPLLRNAKLVGDGIQVSENGEVTILQRSGVSGGRQVAKFLVIGSDGNPKMEEIDIAPDPASSTGYSLVNPDWDLIRKDSAGNVITKNGFAIRDGSKRNSGTGGTVYQYTDGPMAGITRIKVDSDKAPLGIQFDDAGRMLGNMLGGLLAGDNKVAQVLASSTLSTIGNTLGGLLNAAIADSPTEHVNDLLESFDDELLLSLQVQGIGAVSSYLVSQLVSEIGINGFAGDVTNAVLSDVLANAITNLLGLSNSNLPFDGVNVVASVIGKKLAGAIWTPDTIGGQLGASLGASLGAALAGKLLGTTLTRLLGASLAGPVGIVIGTLLGSLLGGVIGSLFGGTPRSGADVSWDQQTGRFAVRNVYARKGGSKDAAEAVAGQVASNFNSVLDLIGGRLADPSLVQTGNYGMRKSDFVYRSYSTREKSAISARFEGQNAGAALANYGTFLGLSDSDFRIIGGDNYTKRALYATLRSANSTTFDFSAVVGNLTTATQYSSYIANKEMIDAIVSLEADSVFAIEVARTLVNAVELGLNKRAESDWYGGFSAIFTEMGATNAAQIGLYFDVTKERGQLFRVIATRADRFNDTIDILAQDEIEAGDTDDIITVEYSASNAMGIAVTGGVGAINNTTGLKINGAAQTGRFVIDVAANIYAGGGNDIVHGGDQGNNIFGGAGNDTLYGGRLDDWLMGGDGNDNLDAGSASGGFGGNGNLLDGGDGNDTLRGREGSDWLEGGAGVDVLTGGAGDDILTGGKGDGDDLKGGTGSDQYLLRFGDGADIAEEDATGAPVAQGAGDAITQRIAKIENWKSSPLAAGAIRPDWLGAPAGIEQGVVAGGEDAVVLGTGIGIGDIRLQRSGTAGAPGSDLIIQVMQTDEAGIESFSGTQLTIRDWFSNPFKRVEWLRFSDGNEIRIGDITSFIIGGSGDDVLVGTEGNDFVFGGAGNDRLFLLAGDDIGNGGSGNDLVAGDAGRDLVIGGAGADELIGGAGSDAISGDAGADDIYGGADRDILSGGRGDGDLVVGGAGDDTFKYARGDGHDAMFDEFSNHWDVIWTAGGQWNTAAGFAYNATTGAVTGPGDTILRKNFGTAAAPDFRWVGRFDYDNATGTLKYFNPPAGASIVVNSGTDTIEFAPGINLQDVVLRRSGNDLVLIVANDGQDMADYRAARDSITIKDWYLSPGQIEKLAFYATGLLDISSSGTNLVAGTDAADGTTTTPLAGTILADWITAGAGDDVVAGGSGNDILAGNSGTDSLRGEQGDDVLYGGTGNDILDGGAGKDILVGGSGTDTASYASASVATRIRLSFAANNSGDAAGDEYSSIENIVGGSAADDIGGDEGENEIAGGAGDDLLMGGAADDTYIWTATSGADTVREGAFIVEEAVTAAGALADGYTATWTDTGTPSTSGKTYWRLEIRGPGNELVYDYAQYSYAAGTAMPAPAAWNVAGWLGGFSKGNGQQVTRERFDTAISGGNQDVIEFDVGISLADLTFIRALNGVANAAGPDLIVRYNDSATTQITIKDHFTVYGRVEALQFHDGLAVSLANILSATSGAALTGTSADDLMVGQTGAANDLLYGGAGDDVLSGLAGDDQLYGEAGDDVLEGGAGADRLDGGGNAAAGRGDTVRYVKSTAVTVDLRLATGQIGGDAAGDLLVGIENVVGSQTGGDTITGDAGINRIDALDGNNVIDGKGGDDILVAGSGNDVVRGDAGKDHISTGDGSDQAWGGDDDDVMLGGGGIDSLYGDAGDDTIAGGEGDDAVLDGGVGNDEIYGEAGNDTLLGGDGNDLLEGGSGNDLLQGGAGDDVYSIQSNDGIDTIVDSSGANIISFDTPISYQSVWLTQSGSDLKVGVIGENTLLTISNFFGSTPAGRVRAILTSTHTIFLDHPDTLNLIAAMTAASATVPASVPQSIADMRARYWHAGGKAKPIAPATARAIATNEDTAIIIDGNYGVIDHDSQFLLYQLKDGAGPAKGVITNLDPKRGGLTYTPNANANGTDSFILIVSDSDGNATELPVTVTIAAINDAPGTIAIKGGASLAVAENTPGSIVAAGTVLGEFESVDVEGDAITYSLVDDADQRFAITGDGKLIVANPTAINFEAAASHVIRVRVTDAHGASREQDFTVAVQDRNDTNSLPATHMMSVAENSAIGTAVGSVAATDLDQAGDFAAQRYYFWNGTAATAISADGRYAINVTTGQISVNAALNFEAASSPTTYQVIARDNAGAAGYNQVQTAVTIGIDDANEANSLPATYSMTIAENIAVGSVVGSVIASDIDGAATPFAQQRYYFWDGTTASSVSSDGRYAIAATTGQITVNAALNFETGTPSKTYQVIARDNAGGAGYNQVQTAVTIGITDVNEANSLPATYGMTVNENVAVGTTVGTVAATDIDQSGAFSTQRYYFLNSGTASATSSDGRYTINATTGVITTAVALNFEAASPRVTYTVIARDNAGAAGYIEAQTSVTIGIDDLNEANSIAATYTMAVAENAALGTVVGSVAASDADTAGTAFAQQRYYFWNGTTASSVSGDGRYEIDAITGVISIDGALNFEAGTPSKTYQVIARDNAGGAGYNQVQTAVTIGITDVNEANSLPATYSMAVNENVAVGTSVGTVAATDIDQSGAFSTQRYYFLNSGTASATSSDGRYTINATTGLITTAAALNFEAASPRVTYTVIARDNAGAAGYIQAQTSVTIGIDDLNEANSIAATYTIAVAENAALGTVVGSVAASDADTAGTAFAQQRYYFWNGTTASSVSGDGRYEIDAITGVISVDGALNFEAATPSKTYQVIARDNAGGAGYNQVQTAVTIGITDVNEANSLPATYSMAVNENVAVGTTVGTIAATDIDQSGAFSTQRYYFWDGTNATATSSDGRYAINATTGVITANAALNFEAGTPSKTYQVIARDNAGAAGYKQAQTSVTIGINDLNEAPISLNWSPSVASVVERDLVGAGEAKPAIALGTLSVTDPDTAGLPNASYGFAVADTRFEIIGNTLWLKQGAAFDFEAGASVSVAIVATDQTGAPFTINRTIAIAVTDRVDVVEGTADTEELHGQMGGSGRIYGFGGDDFIWSWGDDFVDGGDGDDIIMGSIGNDRLFGGAGNDSIIGSDDPTYHPDAMISGGSGDDIIGAERGIRHSFGDEGNDTYVVHEDAFWNEPADRIDYFDGGEGIDTLTYQYFQIRGINVDWMRSYDAYQAANLPAARYMNGDIISNVENLIATNFDDMIIGSETANVIQGRGGNDSISGGLGDDTLDGGEGNDTLRGDDGADTLIGGAGDDIIYGGSGNDKLIGGDGNDQLFAEAGDDLLDGGTGNDILNGGIDNDTYIVTRTSGADTINNYDPSGDDIDVIGFQDVTGAIEDKDLWFERVGNDLRISVVGTGASVQVVNWYVVADAASRANHKIDFIIAGDRFSRTINIEGLVALMAGKTKPATVAARDALMADLTYKANWATHWNSNDAPALAAIAQQSTNEDTAKSFSVTATDDITPGTQVQLSAQVISGTNVVTNAGISFGTPNASGVRTMTINPLANASGTARIRVTATDAGGISSTQEFDVVVNGVVDTPTVTQFVSPGGTSGNAAGIPLNLIVSFPDGDGSETHAIWITGVPSGATLSAGTYDSASATWKLTKAQIVGLKLLTPAGSSTDVTLTATARATENGQTAVSTAVQLTVAVNAPPTGATFSGSINENAANATVVGSVVGTDPDSDVLTYSLVDNAGGRFTVSSAGVVSVANGTLLNFETTTSHAITVRIADSRGEYIDRSFTVAVNNVNEANSLPATYAMSVNENVAVGTLVGAVAATDLDSASIAFGQQRYYFLNGSATSATSSDGRYTIDAVTGQIKTAAALNFEAGTPSVTYIVIARDNAGAAGYIQSQSSVTIGIANLNEVNTLPTTYSLSVNENVAVGATVGTIAATDIDSSSVAFGQQRYYFLNGTTASATSSDGRYIINATTGAITTAAALNFEAGTTSTAYTVIARDNAGAAGYIEAQTSVTIGIANLNEANTLPATYSLSVNENVAVGTAVGTIAATDIDSSSVAFGQQRYYFLNGATTSSDGRYTINATTGVITTAAALNFEAASPSATYIVVARDNAGAAGYIEAQTSVTIGIANVNEANTLPATYSLSVNENVAVGTTVGTIAATDLDSAAAAFGQQRYYFLNGTATSDDGRYAINATTGVITTAAALNFEAASPSATYIVVARDNAGAAGYTEAQTSVTIGIANVNEANALPATYAMSVNENVAVGTLVGTVAATDPDSSAVAFGQQRYYFLNGSAPSATSGDGRYTIDAVTGEIKTAAALNFEAGITSVAYAVIARDNAGTVSYIQAKTSVTIAVANVNEQNVLPASYSFSVNENQGIGAVVGTVQATDTDVGGVFVDQRYYFLNGMTASALSADGRYQINATTGVITTAAGLNFEAASPSVTYTVIARDNAGAAGYTQAQSSVTIGIANLNEANTLPATYSLSINENVAVGTAVGTIAATDIDSSGVAFGQQRYYFLNGTTAAATSSDGRYAINATTGVITTAAALNFEAGTTSATYTVIARDNAGAAGYLEAQANVTIGIANVNEANTLPATYSMSVNENVAVGTAVGTIAATDIDGSGVAFGQQRYYFLNGGATSATSSDGRYSIDAVTGQIKTAAALNFEAGSTSVTYTVIARDNAGGAGYNQVQTSVTIGIADLNEANSMAPSSGFAVNENVAIGTAVGTIAASDADSSGVAFGQQRYYFLNAGTASATSSDGRYTINATTGAITTAAGLDYDVGTPSVTYTVVARDNAGVGGYNQAQSSVTIGIQNIDEPHTMSNFSVDVNESNAALGPLVSVGNFHGMLSDPEAGANISYRFTNGSTQMNGWEIDSASGQIWMIAAMDYEALTDVYENVQIRDYPEPEWEWQYTGKDPSRAIFNLGVVATNLATGASAQGTLTINVKDVNEAPIVSSYSLTAGDTDSGRVITQGGNKYWVTANRNNGQLINVTAEDPERLYGFTYQITDLVVEKINVTQGGSGEADGSGPVLSIASNGVISFNNPNDGEWEGAIVTNGVRQTLTMVYSFNLRVTDANGASSNTAFEVSFLRRGSSVPPLVFDLDGDGLELVPFDGSTVQFDMDGDGVRDTTGWAGADDGFLALDRNGNGLIDNIDELSFVGDAPGAISDLEGLRSYDSDGDGYFDDGDAEFGRFLIWRDANQDGVSQAYEMKTLAEWGIRAINLSMTLTGNRDEGDNILFATTDYEKTDGTTGTVGDAFLSFDPSNVGGIAPPIVLDFDGDGKSLTEMADNKVRFDMNGDGIADKTGWIEQGDAFLALDRNGNGKIDDIKEISFVADKEGAKTDLEGLAAFDSNGDAVLNGSDARFAEFRLWFDNNANGVTDAGELLSLAQAGVASVSLAGVATGEQAVSGKNIVFNTGGFTRTNGTTGKLLDVGLGFKPLSIFPEIEFQQSAWPGKAKDYRLNASAGMVRVGPRNAKGILSADAGQIADAAELSFGSKTIAMLSAILLDLDGDGLEAKRADKSKAWFDMNGDGLRDDTGWMSGGDGMLVIDRDKDGAITNASELSFLSEKEGAKNGWEGLAALDNNKDGKLDKADTRFGELKVWADRNGDGISQGDEIKSLLELGIAEIGLRNFATSDSVKLGSNLALSTATFKRDNGSTATIGNVALGFTPTRSAPPASTGPESGPIDAANAASNLAQAMSRFGAGAVEGDLRNLPKDGMTPHDWFAAAVA
jgi:Ca2+-binding RTX toxin-like protein